MTVPEAMIWLAKRQIEMYHSKPWVYIDAFCGGACMRKIIGDYYQILTKRGQIMYLETTDPAYKKELKETALEMSKGRLDTEGALDLCKLLHILTYEN